MAAAQKIISALHANWSLSLAGLLLSFGASILLVRALPPPLYAQYAAVLAIISLATLVFEAGANSGLTRYFTEARERGARGTFYLRMQRRRWLAALACGAALIIAGPRYARTTALENLASQPWLFLLIAAVVAGTLARLLAHYGLLALFEAKTALLLQQGFLVLRSALLAVVALAGGGLVPLVLTLVAVAFIEAALVHCKLWRFVRTERAPLPEGFLNRAQGFGLLTIVDKACAALGSGTVLLLVLAPAHSATTIAFLALAADLVGKLVSLTVMPMGNLVAPYLSHTSDDAQAQGIAAARVLKLSSLLYAFTVGAGLLLLPWFVGTVYGAGYGSAAGLALLLLVPTAFENWVRGAASPALLRNGRTRELMRVNAIQAVLTIAAFAIVHRHSVETALLVVGGTRAAVASLSLVSLHRLLPAGSFRVPSAGALLSALSFGGAWLFGSAIPLSGIARAALEGALFTLLFYIGVRWLILRDRDTLHLAHRIAGGRARLLARLLPPRPLPLAP